MDYDPRLILNHAILSKIQPNLANTFKLSPIYGFTSGDSFHLFITYLQSLAYYVCTNSLISVADKKQLHKRIYVTMHLLFQVNDIISERFYFTLLSNFTCIPPLKMSSFPYLQISYLIHRNFIIETIQFLNLHVKIILTKIHSNKRALSFPWTPSKELAARSGRGDVPQQRLGGSHLIICSFCKCVIFVSSSYIQLCFWLEFMLVIILLLVQLITYKFTNSCTKMQLEDVSLN